MKGSSGIYGEARRCGGWSSPGRRTASVSPRDAILREIEINGVRLQFREAWRHLSPARNWSLTPFISSAFRAPPLGLAVRKAREMTTRHIARRSPWCALSEARRYRTLARPARPQAAHTRGTGCLVRVARLRRRCSGPFSLCIPVLNDAGDVTSTIPLELRGRGRRRDRATRGARSCRDDRKESPVRVEVCPTDSRLQFPGWAR
jgi:hypothetical protein